MSCTFWNMRRRMAAAKAAEENAEPEAAKAAEENAEPEAAKELQEKKETVKRGKQKKTGE